MGAADVDVAVAALVDDAAAEDPVDVDEGDGFESVPQAGTNTPSAAAPAALTIAIVRCLIRASPFVWICQRVPAKDVPQVR
jgi:hypothetical protein